MLDDDGLTIRDSQAILVYLAKRYGGQQWWPDGAYCLAQITAWFQRIRALPGYMPMPGMWQA